MLVCVLALIKDCLWLSVARGLLSNTTDLVIF